MRSIHRRSRRLHQPVPDAIVRRTVRVGVVFDSVVLNDVTGSSKTPSEVAGATVAIESAEPRVAANHVLHVSARNIKIAGWLHKWTNYLRGYRQRWFVLDDQGRLFYFRFVITIDNSPASHAH
jgi:hypothetical protein